MLFSVYYSLTIFILIEICNNPLISNKTNTFNLNKLINLYFFLYFLHQISLNLNVKKKFRLFNFFTPTSALFEFSKISLTKPKYQLNLLKSNFLLRHSPSKQLFNSHDKLAAQYRPNLPVSYLNVLNEKLFFLINYISTSSNFSPHANFRLLGLLKFQDKSLIFLPKKFFFFWSEAISLFTNLFYFRKLPLIYSSKFFKKETLSLNWNLHKFSLSTWKYVSNFFTFYTTIYNKHLSKFFKKLKLLKFSFALIVDIEYHFKFLYYFHKFKWYLVALIPMHINPWIVNIALPVVSSNFFVQLFFF